MLWGHAVGPESDYLWLRVQELSALHNTVAARVGSSLEAHEADVGELVGEFFFQQLADCSDFIKSGHGFEGQDVWLLLNHSFDQPSVVVLVLLVGLLIVAIVDLTCVSTMASTVGRE